MRVPRLPFASLRVARDDTGDPDFDRHKPTTELIPNAASINGGAAASLSVIPSERSESRDLLALAMGVPLLPFASLRVARDDTGDPDFDRLKPTTEAIRGEGCANPRTRYGPFFFASLTMVSTSRS